LFVVFAKSFQGASWCDMAFPQNTSCGNDEDMVRAPRFVTPPHHLGTWKRAGQRAIGCVTMVAGILAIVAGLSVQWSIHNSGIYNFEQPAESKHRASQTGDDFEVIRGVNLGGWLVLEPWIVPSLFYQFQGLDFPAIDEKTFCKVLGTVEAKRQLEAFRSAWVTEDDFRKFKEVGLNAVRIPYGYWSWGDQSDFCHNISSIHFLDQAVNWAGKHGIRVLLDLHGVKESQNGFDNSGESFRRPWSKKWHGNEKAAWDAAAWTQEPSAAITRGVLAKTVARYRNRSHVSMFGLINEPNGYWTEECKYGSCPLDEDILTRYYEQAYAQTKEAIGSDMVARVSPVLDVSFRPKIWQSLRDKSKGWLKAGRWGAMMDSHKYFGFSLLGSFYPQIYFLRTAGCHWREELEWQHNEQLPTIVGEWSLAPTDCMTWLNGYGLGSVWNPQSACSYVPCPETFGSFPKGQRVAGLEGSGAPVGYCPVDPLHAPRGRLSFDEFYMRFTRYLMKGHERSRGWFFWNFKCEINDPRWCFLAAYDRGWFPKNLSIHAYSPPIPRCDTKDTIFGSYQNAMGVLMSCAFLFLFIIGSSVCIFLAGRCCPYFGRFATYVRDQTRRRSLKKPALHETDPQGKLAKLSKPITESEMAVL
jgi:glucan 1,3-beta-glucosidase